MASISPRDSFGHVAEVHGPMVDVACDTLPLVHRALEVAIDGGNAVLDALDHLDDGAHVRSIALPACCFHGDRNQAWRLSLLPDSISTGVDHMSDEQETPTRRITPKLLRATRAV
jgi:hypothetical protein